jgi:hypothetical protein
MDINHIHLPASAVASLYASSLVDTGEIAPKEMPVTEKMIVPEPVKQGEFRSLGTNAKNILVVVNNDEAVHVPDHELQFLTNMLTACKLSLADVAIVNINQQPASYKELIGSYNSKIALLFDIEPAGFGLPMSFPFYQIQPFANCSFLYIPSLQEIEKDKIEKSKLWVSLRRLFNI